VIGPSARPDATAPLSLDDLGNVRRVLVLPRSDDGPTCLSQAVFRQAVPLDVGVELGSPPLGVRLGGDGVLWATVPEAAVDEDGDSGPREGDIGSARKGGDVYSVAEPPAMQLPAKSTLRLGSRRPQVRHEPPDCRARRRGFDGNG